MERGDYALKLKLLVSQNTIPNIRLRLIKWIFFDEDLFS